ncbi:MAG: amidohydrolase family protein, partial [Bryobacteraceae bacterium]
MRLAVLLTLAVLGAQGQDYDLVIRGGRVIDPASGLDDVRDIAIAGGKIARVAASIPTVRAAKVIDAKGLYVTPGLVDLHAHVYGYS